MKRFVSAALFAVAAPAYAQNVCNEALGRCNEELDRERQYLESFTKSCNVEYSDVSLQLDTCKTSLAEAEGKAQERVNQIQRSLDLEVHSRLACDGRLLRTEFKLTECEAKLTDLPKWQQRTWKSEGAIRWYDKELRKARMQVAACRKGKC